MGAVITRNEFGAPVLGYQIWTPKPGLALFFFFWFQRTRSCADVSKHVGQTTRRSRITFFDAGRS